MERKKERKKERKSERVRKGERRPVWSAHCSGPVLLPHQHAGLKLQGAVNIGQELLPAPNPDTQPLALRWLEGEEHSRLCLAQCILRGRSRDAAHANVGVLFQIHKWTQ